MNRSARNRFLWLHAGALAAVLLFPLYAGLARRVTALLSGCFLHDYLCLYCPLCGGTRAVEALLRLDLLSAMRYNAFVVLVLLAALVVDVIALIRLLRGKTRLYPIPGWVWIAGAVLMILYWILRNYLMIRHGYDPTGDLVRFWHRGG